MGGIVLCCVCNSLCVRGYLLLWEGRKHNLKQTFFFFFFFFQFKKFEMIFSSTKVRCTGYQRVRQDRFGNKLIVAQVLWHAQFHRLQHGSIWTYMLNSICISIYFQPKSNQTAYEKSTKYFCEHMPYAYQPDSPQTKSISHEKSVSSS